MKAVQISRTGAADVLEYVDLETPRPGPGQVLVKAASISVNFADVMVRQGTYMAMPPLPTVPGMELSGFVQVLGEGVSGLWPGQRVVVLGQRCYAEYVVAPAAYVYPIPDSVDLDAAAALPVNYLTVYHMLHTMGHLEPGQRVLTHAAAGGVGSAVIQLGRLAGLQVVGLASSEEKCAYARRQGIDHVINSSTEDVVGRVKEITSGKGVDLILNAVAGNTFAKDFEMLAPLGQIIWFGMASGPPKANLTRHLAADFAKGVGVRVFHLFFSVALPYPALMKKSFDTMMAHLAEQKIKPHIHERIPLTEASRAHSLLESRKVMGKLILKP
jgi:NADPH:quinone reductase